jgi:uncharacterized integral membrane protein
MSQLNSEGPVMQGEFGSYTIDENDRREVWTYRTGLLMAAASAALASFLLIWVTPNASGLLWAITGLYAIFIIGTGIALWTVHIYMVALHRTLQVFWAIGALSAIVLTLNIEGPLAYHVYQYPASLWGLGFSFAALTGLFIKEALCFGRLETRLLITITPVMVLGQLFQWWAPSGAITLVGAWSLLFLFAALRKLRQPIAPDIGDKSVFEYLKANRLAKKAK